MRSLQGALPSRKVGCAVHGIHPENIQRINGKLSFQQAFIVLDLNCSHLHSEIKMQSI